MPEQERRKQQIPCDGRTIFAHFTPSVCQTPVSYWEHSGEYKPLWYACIIQEIMKDVKSCLFRRVGNDTLCIYTLCIFLQSWFFPRLMCMWLTLGWTPSGACHYLWQLPFVCCTSNFQPGQLQDGLNIVYSFSSLHFKRPSKLLDLGLKE